MAQTKNFMHLLFSNNCIARDFCPALAKAVKTMKKAEKLLLIYSKAIGRPTVGEEGVLMSIILFCIITNQLVMHSVRCACLNSIAKAYN
ncbi:Fcf2 pre-rRNA processing protein [Zea mays]|uniref:Fcf2 pre-rRNA processing protein n=1 Tax=Zea mays TaxID=4577 RepID=A0A1D6GLT3_MAIZE|nr:Fcf2 pre-rRNA processing protein [Zea mays]AQK64266.1 Fcf2 pre-rRNA processing protein [Zea mays]